MNTEEKAKAYDEALDRARKLKENPQMVFYEYSPKEGDTICDYIFPELAESEDEKDELTRTEVVEFIQYTSMNLFGKYVAEVAELIADEVLEEYNEEDDGDLQRAVSYVIIDKFGGM